MSIIIKDDQGLGSALMMDGFSKLQIQEALQSIRTQFKKVAQLALTFLFNQKDIIHDDLKGIGLVDDVTVIDYTLKLIDNSSQ